MRTAIVGVLISFLCSSGPLNGQIQIVVDAEAGLRKISPFLFGRNNSFYPTEPQRALSAEEKTRLIDAGVRFFRENSGNNATKYNWRRRLSSHPDWYNNVYTNDWDKVSLDFSAQFPDAQCMWAFPLLGYTARTPDHNFADWDYNRSQWWEGVTQNLAGGGIPNPSGTKALKDGDYRLYLTEWNADSTVAILDHWFGRDGIGLDRKNFRYWSMDNEPEIWEGTHDDVMPAQISPAGFMQRYFETAKKARALFPDIKLAGPVTANEWQWYNWGGTGIIENGRHFPWLEYFIKAVAEEQARSGIRLLDVLDIHFYPSTRKPEDVVQLHRVFFDRTYDFPEANGVKTIRGGYDQTITKEFIFGRCNEWLTHYLGPEHGVTLALTETGIDDSVSSSVRSVWYASMLGEFMKNEVEIFTPWYWKPGMWETLHLFSRFHHALAVAGTSSDELQVSAYPSINASKDSMTVVLVNRSVEQTQDVTVKFDHFHALNGPATVYSLSSLPAEETFFSKEQNALRNTTALVFANNLTLTLPPMSVTAVLLRAGGEVLGAEPIPANSLTVFPNPARQTVVVKWQHNSELNSMTVIDKLGRTVFKQLLSPSQRDVTISPWLPDGTYVVQLWDHHNKPALSKVFVVVR